MQSKRMRVSPKIYIQTTAKWRRSALEKLQQAADEERVRVCESWKQARRESEHERVTLNRLGDGRTWSLVVCRTEKFAAEPPEQSASVRRNQRMRRISVFAAKRIISVRRRLGFAIRAESDWQYWRVTTCVFKGLYHREHFLTRRRGNVMNKCKQWRERERRQFRKKLPCVVSKKTKQIKHISAEGKKLL